MEFIGKRTGAGIFPMTIADTEAFSRLPEGVELRIQASIVRSPGIHRKYFKFLRLAYENLPAEATRYWATFDAFRTAMQVHAGHYDSLFLGDDDGAEYRVPRSIAYASMDETEFKELFERVKDAVANTYTTLGVDPASLLNEYESF